MKTTISLRLKKALLASFMAGTVLCNTTQAADITINAAGGQALSGWENSGSTLTFATGSEGAAVTYNSNLEGFNGLTVNVDGASLKSTSNSGNYILTPRGSTINMNINGNFEFDLGSAATSPNQYSRNVAIGNSTMNINIATDKTFTLKGDMVGDSGSTYNIAGGGILAYTYTDAGTEPGTQHAGVNLNISQNSTWNLSTNNAAQLSNLMLRGTVTLNTGNITLMSGAVTWDQAMTVTGSNSLTGATSLDLTGTLTMTTGSLLNFGNSALDASTLNFDLSGLIAGDSFSLSGANITGLTDGDSFSISATQTGTWADAGSGMWILNVAGISIKDIAWKGGDGTMGVGVGGWTQGGTDVTFAQHDNVTIGGPSIAGGTITIDGEVQVGSLTVTGDVDFTLTADATSGAAVSTLASTTGLLKSGTGVLNLDGTLGLAGAKQISGGTLHIASADAIGEGQIQIASGATLSTAENLGEITTWSGDLYDRSSAGYTVNVGSGTTLKDNVKLTIGGNGTTISGGGTYEIWGFTLSATNNQSNLTVAAGTTLVIKGEAMSNTGLAGAFMLSNWPHSNTVTVGGVLDSNAGISMRDGTSATINVVAAGELILRKGLAAVGNASAKTISINVVDGATVALGNKSYDGLLSGLINSVQFTARLNMLNGSKMRAANEVVSGSFATTTVSDSIHYAENASVTFVSDRTAGYTQNLVLDHVINLGAGKLTTEGQGIVTFGGNVTAGSAEFSNQVNINDGSVLNVNGAIETSFATYEQNDNSKAISITANSAAFITTNGLYNITANNIKVASSAGLPLVISNTTMSNSELGAFTYNLEGDVILDNTVVDMGAMLNLANNANLTLKGNSLTALDLLSNKSTVDLTLVDYNATATVTSITPNQSITTQEGGSTTMDLYALNIADLDGYLSLTLLDSLIVNLDLTADQYAAFSSALDGNGVAFSFDQNPTLGMPYEMINFNITVGGVLNNTFTIRGEDGNILYVPEPSTATLSLLALAGLLARRRRKAA